MYLEKKATLEKNKDEAVLITLRQSSSLFFVLNLLILQP